MREEKLGILCSGRGSNLAAIIEAVERGEIRAEIAVVIADKPEAKATRAMPMHFSAHAKRESLRSQ